MTRGEQGTQDAAHFAPNFESRTPECARWPTRNCVHRSRLPLPSRTPRLASLPTQPQHWRRTGASGQHCDGGTRCRFAPNPVARTSSPGLAAIPAATAIDTRVPLLVANLRPLALDLLRSLEGEADSMDGAGASCTTRCGTQHCLTALPLVVVTRPHDPLPAANCSRSFSTIGSTHGYFAAHYGCRRVTRVAWKCGIATFASQSS